MAKIHVKLRALSSVILIFILLQTASPAAKSFVLTPVAPHNLNARPLIIPESTKIKMRTIGRENEFSLSLDSRITIVQNTTEIFVEKAPFTIKMIELKSNSFIKTLRKKLLWGEDTRNK